jgi:hypothetical protein
MKTICDIISRLTDEEKDMHCEIIKECLARETDLAISRETILKNSRKLAIISEKIVEDINRFNEIFTTISGLEKEMKHRSVRLRLLSIPDDKFFHG